jgi:hypothetical protein
MWSKFESRFKVDFTKGTKINVWSPKVERKYF